MVHKYYEEFCFWRNRRAISIAEIEVDYSENNISADDYCHLYGNIPFKNPTTISSIDIDTKPISLLMCDIEIAYRDYISYLSYRQYYEYWLTSGDISNKLDFIEDFIDTNSLSQYIVSKKAVFEKKITSIVNWFIYVDGFDNLIWLQDLLRQLLTETLSEIKIVEVGIRNLNSGDLSRILKNVFISNNLNTTYQKTFAMFYLKMSSFDTCRKAIPYLNKLVEYVDRINNLNNNEIGLSEIADPSSKIHSPLFTTDKINFVSSNPTLDDLVTDEKKENNLENFEILFADSYKAYIDQIMSMLTSFEYCNGNMWKHKHKYVARMIYEEFVKLRVMKDLGYAKAARCFNSKFSAIKKSAFVCKKADKIIDGARNEQREKVKIDLLIVVSKLNAK